jgi:tetratricopeptide (TPR) repeat protein
MSRDLQQALQRALSCLQSGQAEQCLRLSDDILASHPGLIQALYLRGCAAARLEDFERAASDLAIVYQNHPEHLQAAYQLGHALRAAKRLEDALQPLQAAALDKQLEVASRYELADCLGRLRRRPEAIEQYQAILALQPRHVQAAANLSSLLERENRLEEAEHWNSRALAMDPHNQTAGMTRATLDRRGGQYSLAEQRLRRLVEAIDHPVNRSIAWNQLGQCLEAQQQWDEAYRSFSESNRILQSHHPASSPDPQEPHGLATLARIRDWLQGRPLAAWQQAPQQDAHGIVFLVGFPRSGTTLLDRMLSAHDDIEVLEEKSLFARLHQDWSAAGTLEALAKLSEAQLADGRAIYLQEMSRLRLQPQRPTVVDKLPLNLAYLFLIYRLFPQAPVIFLQRHPLDACLSCYFQAFELVASMAYFLDLGDTARYYDAVMQVAALSLDQVGNPLHRLRYEDLVAAPEEQLRLLLQFLGLQWQDSLLQYHQQAPGGASNTPSYQQVLQAPHQRSVGKWRHYRQQLEPWMPLLQPWVEYFGYSGSE